MMADLPSRFKPGDLVQLNLQNISWFGAQVKAVRFTDAKVYYDLEIWTDNYPATIRGVESHMVVADVGERNPIATEQDVREAITANSR